MDSKIDKKIKKLMKQLKKIKKLNKKIKQKKVKKHKKPSVSLQDFARQQMISTAQGLLSSSKPMSGPTPLDVKNMQDDLVQNRAKDQNKRIMALEEKIENNQKALQQKVSLQLEHQEADIQPIDIDELPQVQDINNRIKALESVLPSLQVQKQMAIQDEDAKQVEAIVKQEVEIQTKVFKLSEEQRKYHREWKQRKKLEKEAEAKRAADELQDMEANRIRLEEQKLENQRKQEELMMKALARNAKQAEIENMLAQNREIEARATEHELRNKRRNQRALAQMKQIEDALQTPTGVPVYHVNLEDTADETDTSSINPKRKQKKKKKKGNMFDALAPEDSE